jgi:transcriptional regulator with XRE-family HTH domain
MVQERTKLTNEALAEKLKISPTTLTGLMRARSNVSDGMLEKIAANLDLTIWNLLEHEPKLVSLSSPPPRHTSFGR